MTIFEELQSIPVGLCRHFFIADHAEQIRRALALGELPKSPKWNPAARWPWLGWERGTPPPREGAAGASVSLMQTFESLPMPIRQEIYRRHKDAICAELETLR